MKMENVTIGLAAVGAVGGAIAGIKAAYDLYMEMKMRPPSVSANSPVPEAWTRYQTYQG